MDLQSPKLVAQALRIMLAQGVIQDEEQCSAFVNNDVSTQTPSSRWSWTGNEVLRSEDQTYCLVFGSKNV